jgi:DNA-directed RNA polymerase specialized sigma24 family protein
MLESGDSSEVWGVFKNAYEPTVRGFITARVDSPKDVEELVSKVFDRLPKFDPDRGSFLTFIRRVCSNVMIDHYRGRNIGQRVVFLIEDLHLQRSDGDSDDPKSERDYLAGLTAPELTPEELARRNESYEWLLRTAFEGDSPPHQLIAFGFVKLLEWRPAEVVDELSEEALMDLGIKLEDDYLACGAFRDDPRRGRDCFVKFRQRMKMPFAAAIDDPTTLATYDQRISGGTVVGETLLVQYYTSNAEDNIVQWWDAVRRRLRAAVARNCEVRRIHEGRPV